MSPEVVAPREVDSAAVRNDDFHLAIKLKLQGLSKPVRPLQPPRRVSVRLPILHESSLADAGVVSDAKQRIDDICRQWADDTGEGFVTLVAHRGAIITHEPFGRENAGGPITRDYRCDVASITKAATAILFARFLDQGLIALDDQVSTVFVDYPRKSAHVPTFRQCLTHTSGLSGHGEFGGCRNPHFENIILNAIDVNEPGEHYNYTGTGYELVAKAMEIVAGKSWRRLYEDQLFHPLGMGDVPMSSASSGAHFTAFELAMLAQLRACRPAAAHWVEIPPSSDPRSLALPAVSRFSTLARNSLADARHVGAVGRNRSFKAPARRYSDPFSYRFRRHATTHRSQQQISKTIKSRAVSRTSNQFAERKKTERRGCSAHAHVLTTGAFGRYPRPRGFATPLNRRARRHGRMFDIAPGPFTRLHCFISRLIGSHTAIIRLRS